MAADRMNINRSWEHIQQKYVGTGHVDMSKYEWASNVHRDSIASHVGHADRLLYFFRRLAGVPQNSALRMSSRCASHSCSRLRSPLRNAASVASRANR